MNNLLKVGDVIECKDKDDLVEQLCALAKQGIETDWDDGEVNNNIWRLHVIDIQEVNG